MVGTMCALALSGCSDNKSDQVDTITTTEITEVTTEATTEQSTEVTTEATTEATSEEEANSEMASYSNSGGTYTLNVDSYVEFIETTTDPTSGVNNEDGLEVNYGDTYITIQRFPNNMFFSDVEGFRDYLGDENILPYIVAEDTEVIQNADVIEWKNQVIEMKSGNTVFVGYLYYFKTENGFYKASISGSDLELLEHYKNFVDDMTFNK